MLEVGFGCWAQVLEMSRKVTVCSSHRDGPEQGSFFLCKLDGVWEVYDIIKLNKWKGSVVFPEYM